MSITFSQNPDLVPGSRRIPMAALLEHGLGNAPEYVVLAGLDRHQPLAGREPRQGFLQGNGKTYDISPPGSDSYGFGLVFTHTVKGFYNGTYGYLDELLFTPSCGSFRSEYLSLYGFGKAGLPDVALRARLEAEVSCPLFDAGVFGIEELYPDASHLGTLDLLTWAVFSEARVIPGSLGTLLSPAPKPVQEPSFGGGSWQGMARAGDLGRRASAFKVA